jgi:hypothetical protein
VGVYGTPTQKRLPEAPWRFAEFTGRDVIGWDEPTAHRCERMASSACTSAQIVYRAHRRINWRHVQRSVIAAVLSGRPNSGAAAHLGARG